MKNITAWNNILGISIYSFRFTIIFTVDLITILEIKKIQLYKFFIFLSQDFTVKTPLEYTEVCGYYLYLAIDCDP